MVIVFFQEGKTVRAVPLAEFQRFPFINQADIVIIPPDIHHAVFHQFGPGHRGAGLPGFQECRIFGEFEYVEIGRSHAQRAFLPLLSGHPALLPDIVKPGLSGNLTVLPSDILHHSDDAPSLVHPQQYRVPLVLGQVHPVRPHPCSVTVQRFVAYSYSFAHFRLF